MKLCAILPTIVCLLCPLAGYSQEAALPKPAKEHQWLEKFAGQWTSTAKTVAAGDRPVTEAKGSMKSRMLGGFWVVNEIQAEMSGMKFQAVQTLGYDTKQQKYVGTWVDSMMNHLWQYQGHVDESGQTLILEAEGPGFTSDGNQSAKYRDVYEFKSPNRIVTKSEIFQDGKWVTFMAGEINRVKPAKDQSSE